MLVTVFEAFTELPKMETVMEHLLCEEHKMKEREDACHYCGKPGHFKRNCRKWSPDRKDKVSSNKKEKWKVNKAAS